MATNSSSTAHDTAPPFHPSKMGEFLAFLKAARKFKGDLSGLSAPAFLLSPISLIEFPSYWGEEAALLVAAAKATSPVLRALAVLKWYLCTLRAQFAHGGGKKKKPLNPCLGELFLGHWDDDEAGSTELVVEQVSHHPPVSAYRFSNARHQVRVEGYYAQQTYFRGMPRIERVGLVMVYLDAVAEHYLVTLPSMHLEGLIPPPPHPELDGTSYIVGSNGTRADIHYSGRGWFRGQRNSFEARLTEPDSVDRKPYEYLVQGQWQGGSFTVYDAAHTALDHVDMSAPPPLATMSVAPLADQDPMESRRLWHAVSTAIVKGDLGTVNREKNKIEEEQRALRRKEHEDGIRWESRFFEAGDWHEAKALLASVGRDIREADTRGIWRWKAPPTTTEQVRRDVA